MTRSDPERIVCDNEGSFGQTALKIFFDLYRKVLSRKKFFTLLLSGGKTPEAIYSSLADPAMQSKIDWSRVHLFWGDERFVPSDHPESNYGAVKNLLISKIKIPPSNVHRIQTEGLTPREASEKYQEDLRAFFKIGNDSFPRFDLILLGVGEDGHTASLFPGIPELGENKRWVVSTYLEKLKSRRITLTLPVLNHGENILVLAEGEKKAEVLKKLFKPVGLPLLPIQQIHPIDGELTFLLDHAAASQL
jgi:6-phosphogluconolactonase